MKRRTVLAGFVPTLQLGRWLDRLLLVNQGEVKQKRLVGRTEGDETEIAVITADETAVMARYEALLGESPGEVSRQVTRELQQEYDELRFYLTVTHRETGLTVFGRTGTIEYRTSRILYSGIEVTDRISFQTSLLNRDTIVSLSCLVDEAESLQRRCRVGIKDPTEEQ